LQFIASNAGQCTAPPALPVVSICPAVVDTVLPVVDVVIGAFAVKRTYLLKHVNNIMLEYLFMVTRTMLHMKLMALTVEVTIN